ncbi:phage terminase small subunit P27 family [Liquorilactobacillus uvarum]|uniref:phage terminase small subunit P27 family n=1 Tax=Liquorilactobacillus uvarum TaxID=303240 RepID=UPI00288B2676|nr:phage terminase small subunit P27 family [Liquorilactobacillus uvarum]
MLAKRPKLSLAKSDRKYVRERTEKLVKGTKDMQPMQVTPPKHLNGVARYAWTQIVDQLNSKGWLKETDKPVLELLCVQLQVYREAYAAIFISSDGKKKPEGIQTAIYKSLQDASGKIVGQDFLGYKPNPAVSTLDKASKMIKSLSETLGLTPQARATLLSLAKPDKPHESLGDLLNRKSEF